MVTARVRVTTTITVWDRVRLSVALRNRARGLLQGSGLGGKGVGAPMEAFSRSCGCIAMCVLVAVGVLVHGMQSSGCTYTAGVLVTMGVLMKMGDRCMYSLR